jgi:hypothetical protein
MGRACSTYRREMLIRFWGKIQMEIHQQKDLHVSGKITLKRIVEKQDEVIRIGFI